MFFTKREKKKGYDPEGARPVIRCSICTGEKVAGFQDIHTKAFQEVMLIRNEADLRDFRRQYAIDEDIPTIY